MAYGCAGSSPAFRTKHNQSPGYRGFIDAFLFRHPAFKDVAFIGLWGTLQLLDSEIMEEAIHRATEQGIPVLPVHDELVGPVSKKEELRQILIDSFHEVTQGKFSDHEPKMTWSTA